MTDQPAPAHAPIPGAYTISGTPRCVCGYHHHTRYGTDARQALADHITAHTTEETRTR